MSTRPTWLLLGATTLAATLGLTFWLYGQSEVIMMLSDQLWSCF